MATKEQKQVYAKERAKGQSRRASAIVSGLPMHIVTTPDMEKTGDLAEALKRELAEARKHAGTTKEDVIDIIMDAINYARILQDPACMIMGARELSKMLGYNAPEVKKVEHELGGKTLAALENLSDSELLKISKGRVIDGAEYTKVSEPS